MVLVCAAGTPARAYTPEDPAVIDMVDRGIAFLEANLNTKTFYELDAAYTGGFGEHALIGYAHMKVMHDPSNPLVQRGIRSSQLLVKGLSGPDPGGHSSKTVYAASVAALLLAEVDAKQYRSELQTLAGYLKRVQYQNGAYGYFGEETGDVSQTQYAMLALWTLDRTGIPIDYPGIVETAQWLLRVQDPTGGWPYQGVDPNVQGQRIPQTRVTASMAVAGGSAILIAGDVLRLWGDAYSGEDTNIEGLPKALKLYVEGVSDVKIRRPTMPTDPIVSAVGDCQAWLAKTSPNPGKVRSDYPYYQLYTLERYESFREIAFALDKDPGPAWYNEGVEFLKAQQQPPGGWPPGSYSTSSVSTAFSVLFLIRSTQRAILQASSGRMAGGQSLPKDTSQVVVEGTEIKGKPVATAVSDLLNLLEDDGADEIEGKSIPEDLKLATDPKERQAQLDRLERLVRGSQSWQARRVAARLLGKSDELRVVPSLIFALSDPDSVVKRYARDGLRFISRKFEGFGMPDKPTDEEIRKAQRDWRQWYLTINPAYRFDDQLF